MRKSLVNRRAVCKLSSPRGVYLYLSLLYFTPSFLLCCPSGPKQSLLKPLDVSLPSSEAEHRVAFQNHKMRGDNYQSRDGSREPHALF